MRRIDADALMETVEGVNWYHIDKLGYLASGANSQEHTPIYKAEDIYNAIRNAPTVDAVEVVHAEWACVNESDNVWMCTGENGCGNEILLLEGTPTENGWHYCPSCGAKMSGGNEDV